MYKNIEFDFFTLYQLGHIATWSKMSADAWIAEENLFRANIK